MMSSEWNKIWCTVDVANYTRSLGHQGIMFKMTFKKVLSTKAFAAQIKAIMEAQMACCAALMDPLYVHIHPQHQLAYNVEDADVLCDAIKLTFSYLLCTSQQHPAPPSTWPGRTRSRWGCTASCVHSSSSASGTSSPQSDDCTRAGRGQIHILLSVLFT